MKNVGTLIVKVFEINTRNYYRENLREVNTDVNLDGLVANQETTHTYAEPPLRRVRRHFEFPELNKAGVYVIDFIGSAKSSRAVIRKGRLRHLERTTVAGHIFTVMDEQNRKLPAATLTQSYSLEYGEDAIEVHRDAIAPGERVLLHDDLLATGGTILAAVQLVERMGGVVAGLSFLVELSFLHPRNRLRGRDILSLVAYDAG